MRWPFSTRQSLPKTEYEAPAKGVKGATLRVSTKRQASMDRWAMMQELDQHRAFGEIYETTVAGSIIDTEADDIFAQGWAVQGEDPDQTARVREYLEAVDFEQACKQMVVESKVYGFGIAEVGKLGARHVLVPHASLNIVPVHDGDGWLDGFRQMGSSGAVLTEWDRRQVITLALRPSASAPGIGRSELASAYSAIINYEDIRKANCEMVLRMGYPTYEVEFEDGPGNPGAIEGEIADLAPGSAFATAMGAKINTLNTQGIAQVGTYAEMGLQGVAVAMQVPRSMVGLSDNSEATAKVTQGKYYNRISAEQKILAHVMQTDYIDRYVLADLGIPQGTVQIIFNNPDPDAQLKKAQLLQVITSLDATDPEYLLSVEEQAEIWGKHPKAGEYDGDKIKDALLERVAQHIAGIQAEPAPQPQEGEE